MIPLPDKLAGKRAGQPSNRTGEWLRNKVGITDPISRFTACGIPGLPICGWHPGWQPGVKDDIERYLTAHGKKDEHGGYSEYPAKELRLPRPDPSSRRAPGQIPAIILRFLNPVSMRSRFARCLVDGVARSHRRRPQMEGYLENFIFPTLDSGGAA